MVVRVLAASKKAMITEMCVLDISVNVVDQELQKESGGVSQERERASILNEEYYSINVKWAEFRYDVW